MTVSDLLLPAAFVLQMFCDVSQNRFPIIGCVICRNVVFSEFFIEEPVFCYVLSAIFPQLFIG